MQRKKEETYIYWIIFLGIAVLFLIFILLTIHSNYSNELAINEEKIDKLESQIFELQLTNINYKVKANFLDENIVFVLEGYGKFYYTYDQVQKVTKGEKYRYWAYNERAALQEGYKPWK